MKKATAAASWYLPLATAPITANATSAFIPALPASRSFTATATSGAARSVTEIAAGRAAKNGCFQNQPAAREHKRSVPPTRVATICTRKPVLSFRAVADVVAASSAAAPLVAGYGRSSSEEDSEAIAVLTICLLRPENESLCRSPGSDALTAMHPRGSRHADQE